MKNKTALTLISLIFILPLIAASGANSPNSFETQAHNSTNDLIVAETDFSIMLLPDTQYYTRQFPDLFTLQTRWITKNRETLNIAYVAGLGDITNLGDGAPEEWQNARQSLAILEDPNLSGLHEGIPYGLAVGNHDQSPMDDPLGATENYNRHFGVEHFLDKTWYGGNFATDNDSHYDLLTVGKVQFIVIYIEYGAVFESDVLDWADQLLKKYPERVGIVVSHYLLEPEGLFSSEGETIYQALKANKNLALMLGGHNWAEAHRMDVFDGNTVYTLMADYSNRPNGGDGWLQILTFAPQKNQLHVTTYSPYLDQYETDPASQFRLPFQLSPSPVRVSDATLSEPVFHIVETQTTSVAGGATDIIIEQADKTSDAIQGEIADTSGEIKDGFLEAMTPQDIDSYVFSQMDKHGLPGVAVAVIEGDEIAYLQGYGTCGTGCTMTPQTRMFIGSVSKSFTALAIAQLVEAGKLDLNEPVQTYIPWFRIADEQASAQITIRHLLQHTSGLSEAGYSAILPNDASLEEAVRSLEQAHLTAPVGTRHQYFNLGYSVLGYLIELCSGETYADYIQTHILSPLKMDSSTARPKDALDVAQGYTRMFGFNVPMTQPIPEYAVPAGYIVSTVEDMARYALAMKNGGGGLVSSQMMRQIHTPGLDSYGFGWVIYENGELIKHGGANETFHTDVNLYPRADRAFVMLINQGHQFDHFVSAMQMRDGIEDLVLGRTPTSVFEGWSVQWMGWAVGLLTSILAFFQVRAILKLRNWRKRTRDMSKGKLVWDIVLSFLIPTVITVFVLTQVKAFYGYRFNLWPTLVMMRLVLPDVFLLMLIGTLPDYIQGFFKLFSLRKNA